MEIFQFKQFAIRNEKSSMKINTDGVLLGAAMTLRPSDRLLLDIGTGTGTIALMAAQRLAEARAELKSEADGGDFNIIGIDIDEASAAEAAENFASSPWSEKLVARHISLSDFEKECTVKRYNLTDDENLEERDCGEISVEKFNVIFSNPPYFESSLKSPDERKRAARHAETMSYREIIAFASRHLTSSGHLVSDSDCNEGQHPAALPTETDRVAGRLSLILPCETEREAVRYAASFGLRLFRRLRIRTTPSRPLSRVILEFTFGNPAITNDELTIQDPASRSADNLAGYTDSYCSLVRNFLLI